jgi:hypothetical protein
MRPDAPVRDILVAEGEVSTNETIAALFDQVANLLEAQGAASARVAGYRRAASAVRGHRRPVPDVLAREGLTAIAKVVGQRLAGALAEIAVTGRLSFLDTLRGEVDPTHLATELGLGARLVRRVHEALGIVTLTELEIAARDGRLANVRGFGKRRVEAIHDRLATRLGRLGRDRQVIVPVVRVPVEEMLDVDGEYGREAAAGRLPCITPNGTGRGRRSFPILHVARGDRQYTAMALHSGPAHELGTTTDWLLLYVEAPLGGRQAMVVTETTGALAGRRVLRGWG